MTNIAIQVQDLGKQYHIGGEQKTYDRLGDQLTDMLLSPARRAGKLLRGQATGAAELDETIWALKDVSFEVDYGQVVGIIGRNGAGKSTLLKILSRITEPTEGYAKIYGRVGSLLEVGTGFHPELTGRENIYLNGAILGMRRDEIDRKYDEIVSFAEIEKFIDTPVKHYSSGMYVRLAFAVAAHLEPEILLVDEVLAVGDIAFQKKCLGKMSDVTRQGRTVLFVSHNMAAVENLCQDVIWIDQGSVRALGPVTDVISEYEEEVLHYQGDSEFAPILNERYHLWLLNYETIIDKNEDGTVDLRIKVFLKSERPLKQVGLGIAIFTQNGMMVSKLVPHMTKNRIDYIDGECCCVLECPNIHLYLAGGQYYFDLVLNLPGGEIVIRVDQAASFEIPHFDHYQSGHYFTLAKHGLVPLPLKLAGVY